MENGEVIGRVPSICTSNVCMNIFGGSFRKVTWPWTTTVNLDTCSDPSVLQVIVDYLPAKQEQTDDRLCVDGECSVGARDERLYEGEHILIPKDGMSVPDELDVRAVELIQLLERMRRPESNGLGPRGISYLDVL
jgi:hypothetical protein